MDPVVKVPLGGSMPHMGTLTTRSIINSSKEYDRIPNAV